MDATRVCAWAPPRTASGRKTARSRSRPTAGAMTSRVTAAARGSGQCHSAVNWRRTYAHTIAIAPCAKLRTPVARYVTIRPMPVRAAALPTESPASVRS